MLNWFDEFNCTAKGLFDGTICGLYRFIFSLSVCLFFRVKVYAIPISLLIIK